MKSSFQFMVFLVAISFLSVLSAWAQDASNANMEILAEKVRADKKLVVAMNLDLSDSEAKNFWPVYDSYQADLLHVNQRLGQIVSEYADAYNSGTVTDEKAGELIKEWLQAEAEEMTLRVANVKKLAKVLPAKKVARYLQIENKIRAVIRFGLAADVPLVY